jgi:hypothetical protein
MAMTTHVLRYGQRRATRKLFRAMPILGAVAAIATAAAVARRKGLLKGTLDTALDFTPVVGFIKNAVEIVRGRDLIPDRPRPARRP